MLSFFFVVGAACQVEPDANRASGGDHTRRKALEMPLNRVVIDRVDQPRGDQDDWKYFTIPSPGLVEIIVNFDNDDANPGAEIRNAVGQIMSELKLANETDQLRRLSFQATPGNYYLHIWTLEQSSDYTVEVKFQEHN